MSLRILYSSNAFWSASGYGVQGRSLLPRLAELPEVGGRDNIAMFAWYGLQGGVHNVEGSACTRRASIRTATTSSARMHAILRPMW